MFLVSPSEKDKYFHSLCIVHNSSYFNQFSKSRFLKKLSTAGSNLTQLRYHLGKKKITSPPPNWKAHTNKKNTFPHHVFHIYMSDCKNHYHIKQIMKLINCCSKFLYLFTFSFLFKGERKCRLIFLFTLGCIQFCVVRRHGLHCLRIYFCAYNSNWVLHGN